MKQYLLLVTLWLFSYGNSLYAQAPVVHTITGTTHNIKIDGILDETDWQKTEVITQFTQWVPKPDAAPTYRMEVRMLYTHASLCISAVMFQPKEIQRKQTTARDELGRCNADVFSVFLDTYKDQQNGFAFRVSAAGVQQDERLSGGGEYGDVTWDAVWKAKVSSDAEKWIVEMEIPYSAIRFAKKEHQEWGLNFQRLIRETNETCYWSPLNINKQGFLAQEGVLKGLDGIDPPVRLFLFPYFSSRYYYKPEDVSQHEGFIPGGGMDLKYGINESFTIDATLVPDFSQVISDNLIRNLSPFEQQLTDNRPFFTEGTELFNKAGIFYTRRVGAQPKDFYTVSSQFPDSSYDIERNPNVTTLMNAFKFSGRNRKKLGIGVFNALASPMYATIYDKKQQNRFHYKTEPMTNYNVVVLDQALKGQSYINFTNTNVYRQGTAAESNVSSVQWLQFSKKEKHSLLVKYNLSQVFDNHVQRGSNGLVEYRKTSGRLRYSATAGAMSPGYNQKDLGIQFDLNHAFVNMGVSYNQNRPKLHFLQSLRWSASHTVSFNLNPIVFKEYNINVNYFWLFKNFWDVTLEFESKPLVPVNFYFLRSFNKRLCLNSYVWSGINGSSDSRKKIFWAYSIGYGYSAYTRTGYFYSDQSIRYQLKNKIEFQITGSVVRDDGNIGFAFYDSKIQEPVVGMRYVREYEGNFSVKYNYSATMNFTARFRHYNNFIHYRGFYTVDEKGAWKNQEYPYVQGMDENFNLQNIDFFFNWIFKPGSRMVISYKQWLQNAYLLNSDLDNHYFDNVGQIIQKPKAYEMAVRFIFFLDYNHLRQHMK